MNAREPIEPDEWRALVEKRVEYRAEKRWKIFSWASSLMVGTLAAGTFLNEKLTQTAQISLSGTVVSVLLYALFWIAVNGHELSLAKAELERCDEESGLRARVEKLESSCLLPRTYEFTLVALAALAIFLLWMPR